MVAVALSAEVRPLPMVQPPEEEVGQISGTTPVTTTGIDSVDDHIARLKANARQHVDRELSGSRAGKTPYLPSKEIAKTIKCRFFPNCYYGDKCMFFHPSSIENYAAPSPMFISEHVNGISPNGPSSMNGHTVFGGPINGHASPSSQMNGEMPLSPTSNGRASGVGSGEDFHNSSSNGNAAYDMATAYASQNQQQQAYYIPTGYEGQSEYMPYPPPHPQMFSPPPPSHQSSSQQQQQQASSNSSSSQQQSNNTNPYYGFVPYGPHGAYAYPGQPQYPYYPQQQQQQNGVAAYPGMYMPPQSTMQSHDEQSHQSHANGSVSSPVNGVVSPSSSSVAIPDPAIVAQGPESQESTTTTGGQVEGVNGAEANEASTSSTTMEKSSSNQSGKSTSSSKSKKAKKIAASTEQATSTTAPTVNSVTSPNEQPETLPPQNGEFVPMPYYPIPMGIPNEMMMMMPPHVPPHHMPHNHHPYHHHSHSQGQQHFQQSQAYGSFGGSPSLNNGQSLQLEGSNQQTLSSQNGNTEKSNEKKQINGHERTPSSVSAGHMHTYFQTSGNAPSGRNAPSTSNGARPVNGTGGSSSARFNPSSSTTNGPKRFSGPSSGYAAANGGILLPRSGPVNGNGPSNIRRIPYDSNKPTLPCRFFENGNCRHGDLCYYTHLLDEERVIPSKNNNNDDNNNSNNVNEGGKLTRDARLLGLNIGSPDGRISENIPRNPTDFNHHTSSSSRRPPPQAANVGQQQQNGQPNGFGIPQVNSKGRFVHPQQPNTQSFAAQQQQQQQQNQQQSQQQSAARSQQQQQQKEQQMAGLVNNNGADAQEKIQRLISETRNLPSSMPTSSTVNGPQRPNVARPNGIPPTLGRRPPPAHRNAAHGHAHNSNTAHYTSSSNQQRVPSGENDFPALSSSTTTTTATAGGRGTSMERSTSATSSSEKKVDSTGTAVVKGDAPSAASAEAKKADASEQSTNSADPVTSTTASASTPAPAPATAAAAASAPAKPFSWASAAAKAASLPTPPPKRPVSKQRPSAANNANKEKDGNKGGKSEKAEKSEKGQKDTAGKKEADKDVATNTSAAAVPSTTSSQAASAPTAAQVVAAETAPAPAVKA